MARPLRIEYPGAVYHVTSRGNAREKIFLDDGDRQAFIEILETVVDRYNWLCHSYCLMDNIITDCLKHLTQILPWECDI